MSIQYGEGLVASQLLLGALCRPLWLSAMLREGGRLSLGARVLRKTPSSQREGIELTSRGRCRTIPVLPRELPAVDRPCLLCPRAVLGCEPGLSCEGGFRSTVRE